MDGGLVGQASHRNDGDLSQGCRTSPVYCWEGRRAKARSTAEKGIELQGGVLLGNR